MSRLLGMLTGLIVYLSVGSMISLTLIVSYAWSKGYLDAEKIDKMLAVARNSELESTEQATTTKKEEPLPELPTLETLEARRSVRNRNLELREQAVQSALVRIQAEQRKLSGEKEGYDQIKSGFEKQLADLHEGAVASGRENIRLIWENIRAKQAKEQILQMVDAGEQTDVVAILTAMPVAKRAKIIGEFKSETESKKLEELLRLMRQGMPDLKPVESASEQLQEFKSKPTG